VKLLFLVLGLLSWSTAWCGERPSEDSASHDADPHHLWNRLNDTLFVRTAHDGTRYGVGRLDILFWSNTRHLLTSPSHEQALAILDEFIAAHGERLIEDPLSRVLLQRDLWALFDWSASPFERSGFAEQRAALQRRLAVVIRGLALSSEQIAALPDSYARTLATTPGADFPRGLLEPDGPWVPVAAERAEYTALVHLRDFGGRSLFVVLVKLPGGRTSALSYLQRLHDFEPALRYQKDPGEARAVLRINPAVPQFPKGTEWALVRRMGVINQRGAIEPTPLIESIQLRRYLSVGPTAPKTGQRFVEFQLDRHEGLLRQVAADEKDFQFVQFRSMGWDPLEGARVGEPPKRGETLGTCYQCHSFPGILSVNSYNRILFTEGPMQLLQSSTFDQENSAALAWKYQQYEWGLLRGWWAAGQSGQ
jgi:hypothetical protein